MLLSKPSRLLLFACMGALAVGCGAGDVPQAANDPIDPGGGFPPVTPGGNPTPDGGGEDPPPASPNLLTFVQAFGDDGAPCDVSCSLSLEAGSSRELVVRYTTAQLIPLVNVPIAYALQSAPGVAQLSASATVTDMNGEARVTLKALPGGAGNAFVTVSVPQDTAAGSLTYLVNVSFDGQPALQVGFLYVGGQGQTQFQVHLYGPDNPPGCAEIHPDAVGAMPEPALGQGPLFLGQKADFLVLPAAAPGNESVWTVQVVAPYGGEVTAHGCLDGVTLIPGTVREVTVSVTDLPLRFVGTYGITTEMDLVEGLEGTPAQAVATLLEVFTSPAKVALFAACDGASGILGSLCTELISGGELTVTGALVVDKGNGIFLEVMADNLGAQNVFTAQALDDMLRHVIFDSTLQISEEPTVLKPGSPLLYFPPDAVWEVWHEASATWNMPNGNAKSIHVSLAGQNGIEPTAALESTVDWQNQLSLSFHTLDTLTYGLLVNGLVETELLALLFGDGSGGGPDIDSYEDLVATMLGDSQCLKSGNCCSVFTSKVQQQVPAVLLPFVPGACESAIAAAGEWLRNQVVGLGGPLTIGTVPGAPCQALALGVDRWTTNLGTSTEPCAWEAHFATGSPPFSPESTWYGVVE